MADPDSVRAFLVGEVAALEPFDFVAVVPSGRPLHVLEVMRTEGGSLEVRVPGRPSVIPELEPAVRSALLKRSFASEDASDPMKPWVHSVADPAEAVTSVQELLVEVFGEKPDAKLDIAHGSRKAEHEAMLRLDVARKRIEAIVNDILGKTAEQDDDGDYVLPIEGAQVTVAPRIMPDGQIVTRIFAITNVGINVTPDLGLFLARLNFGMMFGRFALDTEHRSIWFDETLLGEEFREDAFRFAIHMVASTTDAWDERLKQMFGGATHKEIRAGRTAARAPTTKPGEGPGLYL